MVLIRGRLEPEVGAVVMQALGAARDLLYQRRKRKTFQRERLRSTDQQSVRRSRWDVRRLDGSPEVPTMEQQEADALALVAETALHRGINPGAQGRGTRPWFMSRPRCCITTVGQLTRCSFWLILQRTEPSALEVHLPRPIDGGAEMDEHAIRKTG